MFANKTIAVVVPCYNEQAQIDRVLVKMCCRTRLKRATLARRKIDTPARTVWLACGESNRRESP
jgi:hypothetical protein